MLLAGNREVSVFLKFCSRPKTVPKKIKSVEKTRNGGRGGVDNTKHGVQAFLDLKQEDPNEFTE